MTTLLDRTFLNNGLGNLCIPAVPLANSPSTFLGVVGTDDLDRASLSPLAFARIDGLGDGGDTNVCCCTGEKGADHCRTGTCRGTDCRVCTIGLRLKNNRFSCARLSRDEMTAASTALLSETGDGDREMYAPSSCMSSTKREKDVGVESVFDSSSTPSFIGKGRFSPVIGPVLSVSEDELKPSSDGSRCSVKGSEGAHIDELEAE